MIKAFAKRPAPPMENANVAIHATIRAYATHKKSIVFMKPKTPIICELT
jgi:hypothetical protein